MPKFSPSRPLVTLVNAHKDALGSLSEMFGKATSPAVTPRVPIEEECPDKIQIKKYHQVKLPITHAEPPRVIIDKAYPEKTQQADLARNN